jgi:hypothetical protein
MRVPTGHLGVRTGYVFTTFGKVFTTFEDIQISALCAWMTTFDDKRRAGLDRGART